jgi:F-type H+-transporting ATPase subunit gamma
MISYEPTSVTVYSEDVFQKSPKFAAYEIEDEVLTNLKEFALANAVYWALVEGHACEVDFYLDGFDIRFLRDKMLWIMLARMPMI